MRTSDDGVGEWLEERRRPRRGFRAAVVRCTATRRWGRRRGGFVPDPDLDRETGNVGASGGGDVALGVRVWAPRGYGGVGGGLGLWPNGPACWVETQWGPFSLSLFFVCFCFFVGHEAHWGRGGFCFLFLLFFFFIVPVFILVLLYF